MGIAALQKDPGWLLAILRNPAHILHMMKTSLPAPVRVEILGQASFAGTDAPGLPFYSSVVEAGFPSPADDFIEQRLNLHTYLVRNEAATFFVRAHGESMIGAGIHNDDILVVDRSLPAEHNRIVIAALDGELTVKRLVRRGNSVWLAAANPDYPDFDITQSEYIHIWGVVIYAIHKL